MVRLADLIADEVRRENVKRKLIDVVEHSQHDVVGGGGEVFHAVELLRTTVAGGDEPGQTADAAHVHLGRRRALGLVPEETGRPIEADFLQCASHVRLQLSR